MDMAKLVQKQQETLNQLEAIHGVLKQEVEEDIYAVDRILEYESDRFSESDLEWLRGFRSGMAVCLDILTARVQGVTITSECDQKPIQIAYFDGATETHVKDGRLIWKKGD